MRCLLRGDRADRTAPCGDLATATARVLPPDVFGSLHAGAVPAEADRLLETVQTHLSGSGSVADTAAALYCHRNTIQQRLNRFAELTGRDPGRPEDAALVVLVLSANRLPLM